MLHRCPCPPESTRPTGARSTTITRTPTPATFANRTLLHSTRAVGSSAGAGGKERLSPFDEEEVLDGDHRRDTSWDDNDESALSRCMSRVIHEVRPVIKRHVRESPRPQTQSRNSNSATVETVWYGGESDEPMDEPPTVSALECGPAVDDIFLAQAHINCGFALMLMVMTVVGTHVWRRMGVQALRRSSRRRSTSIRPGLRNIATEQPLGRREGS